MKEKVLTEERTEIVARMTNFGFNSSLPVFLPDFYSFHSFSKYLLNITVYQGVYSAEYAVRSESNFRPTRISFNRRKTYINNNYKTTDIVNALKKETISKSIRTPLISGYPT